MHKTTCEIYSFLPTLPLRDRLPPPLRRACPPAPPRAAPRRREPACSASRAHGSISAARPPPPPAQPRAPAASPEGTSAMAIERCRIWWPRQLPQQLEQESGPVTLVLFGWLFTGAGSLDAVVSAAIPQDQILRSFATLDSLQSLLFSSNKRMPLSLQESSTYIILGDCIVHHPGGSEEDCFCILDQMQYDAQFVQKENFGASRNNVSESFGPEEQHPSSDDRKCVCGFSALDGFLDIYKKSAIKEDAWINCFSNPGKRFKRGRNQVPMLRHLYLHGQQIKTNHCHVCKSTTLFMISSSVILYDVPTIGRNHYSLRVAAPLKLKASSKKPNWINDLQKKPPVLDLGPIVLAINCSSAARLPVSQEYPTNSSRTHFFFEPVFDALVQAAWNCIGIFLASASTFLYIMILLFQKCLSHRSMYLMIQKVFRHSWNNIHLRSCQILYWPIVLQDTSLSSTVNIEDAHKTATQKHTLWSNIIVDLLMGFVLGAALLLNTENICAWTIALVHSMTDGILRSGCVWLMGVPAGFKLNTELAELLGMISLNAIQIYSTLWFFVGGYLRHVIQGIAFSGIILGFTVPVSFLIDVIQLATLHVTILHWLISMIYSRQIQTVASLWRLFRGRKWNPLRQRLDSYDYTVEQHVVGSLLFTPVLLLIPTTSVFYIFFSILTTTIICLCVILEIVVSVIHSTPYAELVLWVMRRQRFPAGLVLLRMPSSCEHIYDGDDLPAHPVRCCKERKTEHLIPGLPESLISELHSNYATLVEVIRPNFDKIFNRTGFSFCKQLAYGILSGERVPSTLHLQLSPPSPWMNMSITEYWVCCRSGVLSCAPRT
ncbi:hypothetical protein EJB05_34692, partial [Eragrostis curvula]